MKRALSLKFSDMESNQEAQPSMKPRTVIQRVPVAGVQAPASAYTLSPEQTAVVDFVKNGTGNGVINAVAGSGKTFILLRACEAIPRSQRVAIMAYNKAIATEITDKIAALGLSNVTVGTCHSFGLRTLKAIHRNVRIDAPGKTRRMMDDIGAPQDLRDALRPLISIAKQSAAGIAWDIDDLGKWKQLIEHFDIITSVRGDGGFSTRDELIAGLTKLAVNGLAYAQETATYQIDFDDMIWIPLLEDMQPVTYDWVIGDEVQDFNVSRRMTAERMMKPRARALFAGDRNQAIYAFSGADAEGVDLLIEQFDAQEMPLTTTYRCSKAAVSVAQEFVPHIEAGADNKPGKLASLTADQFDVLAASGKLGGSDAILCRLTKPLVKLCLQLIAQNVPAFVEGRNIGNSLAALVKKWSVESTSALVTNLESYRISETRRLLEQGNEYAVEALDDKLDALRAIMEGCDTVADVLAKISRLFDDTENGSAGKRVTLSTVHKSKGREWERVFILGWSKYMPSKRARLDWQKQAENNLMYVAVTRTKDELYFLEEGGK